MELVSDIVYLSQWYSSESDLTAWTFRPWSNYCFQKTSCYWLGAMQAGHEREGQWMQWTEWMVLYRLRDYVAGELASSSPARVIGRGQVQPRFVGAQSRKNVPNFPFLYIHILHLIAHFYWSFLDERCWIEHAMTHFTVTEYLLIMDHIPHIHVDGRR